MSRQLKAAMSAPVASIPLSSAWTRVVPEPARAGGEVPAEQRLDELRDELPQVRMQPVNVLGPLPFRKLRLRPGKVEVQVSVERRLRPPHAAEVRRAA